MNGNTMKQDIQGNRNDKYPQTPTKVIRGNTHVTPIKRNWQEDGALKELPFYLSPEIADKPHMNINHELRMITTPMQPESKYTLGDQCISGKVLWEQSEEDSNHTHNNQLGGINKFQEEESQYSSYSDQEELISPGDYQMESEDQVSQELLPADQEPKATTTVKRPSDKRRRMTSQMLAELEHRAHYKKTSFTKKAVCKCRKTKCLKLYCDCFRVNQTCGEECSCEGCHNLEAYSEQRSHTIISLMDRNPDPFGDKIEDDKHVKGCNCKKSNCLKKYCECYQAKLRCNQNCKCEGCKNMSESKETCRQEVTVKKEKRIKQI